MGDLTGTGESSATPSPRRYVAKASWESRFRRDGMLLHLSPSSGALTARSALSGATFRVGREGLLRISSFVRCRGIAVSAAQENDEGIEACGALANVECDCKVGVGAPTCDRVNRPGLYILPMVQDFTSVQFISYRCSVRSPQFPRLSQRREAGSSGGRLSGSVSTRRLVLL